MRRRTIPGVDVYPGLASFTDSERDRALFFGRDREAKAVQDLAMCERLTVIYSKSGLGKSSLINAGMLQPLRDQGFLPIVARLTLDPNPVTSVINCARDAAQRTGITVEGEDPFGGLWSFFRNHQFLRDGVRLKPVLILDQFEELFTVVRERGYEAMFISELADAARARVPASVRTTLNGRLVNASGDDRAALVGLLYDEEALDLRIMLSMREDYLAELDGLTPALPGIYRTMLRLEPLTAEQARAAIEQPAEKGGFTFDTGTVDEVIDFLSYRKAAAGERMVDPIHLQIVCQALDRARRRRGSGTINLKEVGGSKGLTRILRRYYNSTLRQFPMVSFGWNARRWRPSRSNWIFMNRPRAAISRLCEAGLITRTGFRNSVMERVAHEEYGITPTQMGALVSTSRLLRADSRMDTHFYELTHDTLLQPIRAARNRRRVRATVACAAAYVLAVILGVEGAALLQQNEARRAQAALSAQLVEAARMKEAGSERAKDILREAIDTDRPQFANLDLRGIRLAGFTPSRLGATLSFRGTNFSDGELSNSEPDTSNFSLTDFANSDLSRTKNRQGRFSGARFTNAKMGGSEFTLADFSDADLSFVHAEGADFSFSDLSSAKLQGADLTKVQLVGAIVDGASFDSATITGANFSETAWWTAFGWSDANAELLRRDFPPESYKTSYLYKYDLESKRKGIEEAAKETPEARGAAYNSYAWFIATRGGDLNDAVKNVNLSLKERPGDSAAIDTRGYILLQMNRPKEALDDIAQAVELRRKMPGFNNGGELLYHAYLAAKAVGDTARADMYLTESQSLGYEPTYERMIGRLQPARK